MKLRTKLALALFAFFSIAQAANAGFPDDLSDVVFIESPSVKSWPATARLNVSVGGGNITLNYDKKGVWPRSARLGGCCVASAWGVVKVGGVWHAGTWEYLRPQQTVKKVKAFGGCCHFRGPIGNFRPVNGEIYGLMVSGVARDSLKQNNVRERSNVAIFKWGVGQIGSIDGAGLVPPPPPPPPAPPSGPAINLLLEDDT